MNNNENVKQASQTTVHEAVNTDSELYKLGTIVTAAFAGAVGVWAVVCLSSAFMSEGPVSLVKNLFGAMGGGM